MKPTMWRGWLLAAALAGCATPCMAQHAVPPLLHPLFQDHAVLQRDRPLPVWGHAAPGATVSVTFARQSVSARADAGGRWRATLKPVAAGGPYDMTVRAGQDRQVVRDVLIGDVWLCSGQSNMELPV